MSSNRLSRRSSAADTRILIGIIADVETTIGFLLAGIGETSGQNQNSRNFMMVTPETPLSDVQHFFSILYQRKNIGVILIASDLKKFLLAAITKTRGSIPIILEIPTKSSIVKSMEMKTKAKEQKD